LKEKESLKSKELEIFNNYWKECSGEKYSLTNGELRFFKKMKEKYNLEDIIDSIKIAWDKTQVEPKDKIKYIFGILKIKELNRNNPEEAEKMKIIRENINYFYNKWKETVNAYLKWDTKLCIKDIFENNTLTIEEACACIKECKITFKENGADSYSEYLKLLLENQIYFKKYLPEMMLK